MRTLKEEQFRELVRGGAVVSSVREDEEKETPDVERLIEAIGQLTREIATAIKAIEPTKPQDLTPLVEALVEQTSLLAKAATPKTVSRPSRYEVEFTRDVNGEMTGARITPRD
jgi:hypothetical protein